MKIKGISRRRLASGITLGLAAVGCFYAAKVLTTSRIARAQVVVTPFVLQRDLYSYRHSSAGELWRRHIIARTRDGTKVDEENLGPLAAGILVRRIDYADGRSLMLIDKTQTKTTWPQANSSIVASLKASILNPPRDCVFSAEDTLVSNQGKVLGRPVYEIRHLAVGGETRITTERAYDLGCADLQYMVERRQPDGSYKASSFAKAARLWIGEPDPRLLDPGEDYTEMSPSDAEKNALALLGTVEYPDAARQSWEYLDKLYEKR